MTLQTPRSTRPDTPFPHTTLFRSLGGGPGRSRRGNANRLARLYLLKAADNNPVPRPQALLYHPVAALHRAERDLARFGHVLGANHHHGATLRTDGHRALRNDDAVSLRAGGNASPHELSRQQKTTGVRKFGP